MTSTQQYLFLKLLFFKINGLQRISDLGLAQLKDQGT